MRDNSGGPQSRTASLIESTVNVAVGVGVAVLGQVLVFPLFGIFISLAETGLIAVIFTGISIARSYALRRLFEWARLTGVLR